MKPITKTLLVILAGLVGGAVGMVISFFAIAYILASSPMSLFSGLLIITICPLAGALSAVQTGTFVGRILDRLD